MVRIDWGGRWMDDPGRGRISVRGNRPDHDGSFWMTDSPDRHRRWFRPSLNWLLVLVPAAFAVRFVPGWRDPSWLFLFSTLAIVPLAGWLGRSTDQLAQHLGAGAGGLLNATFGNAAELIISLFALRAGLVGVVKASLTGSIIGNLLLVLGISALAGGVRFRQQKFNRTAVRASCTALLLAAVALVIPGVFHVSAVSRPAGWSQGAEEHLSLAIATVLLLTYGAVLVFSLVTHRDLFAGKQADESGDRDGSANGEPWSIRRALIVLLVTTGTVAWVSEFLVSAIEGARQSLGLTETFVGVIVVAVVGNAAEHATAVAAALKNKMDLTIGVAVGSSLQIALFVTPLLVFASLLFSRRLDLEFSRPEIAAVVLAVLVVQQIAGDGESNWLEGMQLLAVYLVLAILFFFLPPAASAPG